MDNEYAIIVTKKGRRTIFLNLIISTFVIIFISGCSTTMSLHYEKPTFKEMNRGKIFVVVNDQRPTEEGGNDPKRVGTIRNGVGMPFPLNSSADRNPSRVIKELVSDCLKATGYNVSEQPSNVPQMHVVIKSFWSDGYHHQRIWTILPAELKKDNHSPPVWEHTFESSNGVTWTAGYGPFDEGINEMLEDLKSKMLAEFNDPKFYKSLKSF